MSILADAIIRDVIASRPAFGIAGRLFYASDTGAQYYDTGAAWVDVTGALSVTTKGDLQGFSTVPARLPVGTDGKVLTADSGAALGVSWQPAGGGSGGVIGVCNFNPSGGSIASLHVGGVIAGVTYLNSGRYTITFTTAQTNFSIALCATSLGAGGVAIFPSSTTLDVSGSVSSFDIEVLTASLGAFGDAKSVTVTISKM